MRKTFTALCVPVLLATACGGEDAIPGTQVRFEPSARSDFYAAPFPSEHRRLESGRIDLTGLPNPEQNEMGIALRRILAEDADGFSRTAAIYFAADGALAPTEIAATTASDKVKLLRVDTGPHSAAPIDVVTMADGGPFGAPHMLALIPLQGRPLAKEALHLAYVRRDFADAAGQPLGVAASTRALLTGEDVDGLSESARADYDRAIRALEDSGVALDEIAALTVFRTGDPERGMRRAVDQVLAGPLPELVAPLLEVETFPDFCVLEGAVELPVFQAGEPPYDGEGGAWQEDDSGALVLAQKERARIVVTIPRSPRPSAGWPTVLFVRTGGGGDRPLVDRGQHATAGGPAIAPGSGPALGFARAGWAGVSVDGPHGGLRNVTGGDEQFLIFNFANPIAMRDNLRQSALELVLIAELLPELSATSGACGDLRVDPDHLALFGHSMGSTIGPLALALQPRLGAAILSGAGGSWIQNVLYKQKPIAVRPLAEILVGYSDRGRTLTAADPILNWLQWAGEPADPPVYGAQVDGHVLMFQGIDDTYIPPPVANALSLALELDAIEPVLDAELAPLLPLAGGSVLTTPVSGNRAGKTRVLSQHMGDGIENGHEVVYQTEAPKLRYTSFLSSAREGTPVVTP